jgi:hypothetical protein
MNVDRLHEILWETTRQFRKGPAFAVEAPTAERPFKVVHVYAMPPVDEAPAELELVDLEFLVIGVDKAKALARRVEVVSLLGTYPEPARLAGGPSYIEVGAVLGDQAAAFCLFALGKVLGLWGVITPAQLGFEGDEARQAAGSGLVMITGYRQAA